MIFFFFSPSRDQSCIWEETVTVWVFIRESPRCKAQLEKQQSSNRCAPEGHTSRVGDRLAASAFSWSTEDTSSSADSEEVLGSPQPFDFSPS